VVGIRTRERYLVSIKNGRQRCAVVVGRAP
jgi:hypothetical protein